MRATCLVLVTAAIVSGCATYGQDMLYEKGGVAPTSAIQGTAHTASVYLVRERAWGQSMMWIQIPPIAYAVDGRIISVLPLGTHVNLQLAPGKHRFSRLMVKDYIVSRDVDRVDLSLDVEAGKTYFVATENAFGGPTFSAADEPRGLAILKETVPAKIIFAPITVDNFVTRIKNNGAKQPKQAAAPKQGPSISDFLPSQEQIGSFFEAVATVAMVALIVVGAGAASASQPAAMAPHEIPPAIYSSAGRKTEVARDQSATRVRNANTGVTYTITEDRIVGTDGSRYRVSGNNIYSSTGEYYQRVGNHIFGNDGRSCSITGTVIDCNRR